MTIENEADLAGLRKAGKLVRAIITAMCDAAQPGVTTRQLDQIAARMMAEAGARAAPILYYQYPGHTCISVNDVAAHGIPDDVPLKEGDVVSIDVSLELDGYVADACETVGIGEISPTRRRLLKAARAAMDAAIAEARTGKAMNTLGAAAERTAKAHGMRIIRDLAGHGVGRSIHEPPQVPNYYDPGQRAKLGEGLVLAIEPHVTLGKGLISEDRDGWSLRTRDREVVAVFEQTIVVTKGKPIIVTA